LDLRKGEVVGGWRKLHNAHLHNLCASPHITRVIKSSRIRWVGHVTSMKEIRIAYKILVGEFEGKRPLGRCRCEWEDNIRMNVR